MSPPIEPTWRETPPYFLGNFSRMETVAVLDGHVSENFVWFSIWPQEPGTSTVNVY